MGAMNEHTTAIHIDNLSKQYRGMERPAVDGLSLDVQRGEIFGFLGPNGAGKTTTIRCMLDLIRPTDGRITICGLDARRDSVAVKRHIGNLPGELRLWDHLSGRDTLRYLSDLRPDVDPGFVLELAERLRFDFDVRAGSYSTGNKRKLGLIQAMMHRPDVLILDEPTTGLDPLMRQAFNDLVREARDEGRTVFLSSHVLSEVEAVCDRVAILRGGKLQAIETMAALRDARFRLVTLVTDDDVDVAAFSALDDVSHVERGVGWLRMRVYGTLDGVVKQAARYTVRDMRIEEPRLEDVFMGYYGAGAK